MSYVLVVAEKADLALKLALGLGDIKLESGRVVTYDDMQNHMVKSLLEDYQRKTNYLMVEYEEKYYKIVWASGHLVQAKPAKEYDKKYEKWNPYTYPVIPEKIETAVNPKTYDIFKFLEKELNNSNVEKVYNGCDADREGQAIFDLLYEKAKCRKPIKRLWIQSLTKEGVQSAFKNLKNFEDMVPLSNAAKCRIAADWLLNINLTVLCTEVYGKNLIKEKYLSIGRVQTPILAAIVERDKQIDTFHKEKHYSIRCYMKSMKNAEEIIWMKYTEKSKDLEEMKLKADKFIGRSVIVRATKPSTKYEKPPKLYSTATLDKDADAIYGLTAKETEEAAESLYLKGIITYPRTDSCFIRSDMQQYVSDVIKNLPEMYQDIVDKLDRSKINIWNDRVFDDNKSRAHTAIIPTHTKFDKDTLMNLLSDNEVKVYGLVVRNFLKSFMPDAKYKKNYVEASAGEDIFIIRSSELVDEGYKYANNKLFAASDTSINEDDFTDEAISVKKLENIKFLDEYTIIRTEVLTSETSPPKHYSDSSIISLMENASKIIKDERLRNIYSEQKIGTPATRSRVIENLIKSGYVKRVKKRDIVATPLGHNLIDALRNNDIKTADITAEWEYKLGLIEAGQYLHDKFIEEVKDYTQKQCDLIKKDLDIVIVPSKVAICRDCGGKILKSKFNSYYCENTYKGTCGFKAPATFGGKVITEEIIQDLMTYGRTEKLNGFISIKNKNTYPAYIILEKADDVSKLKITTKI